MEKRVCGAHTCVSSSSSSASLNSSSAPNFRIELSSSLLNGLPELKRLVCSEHIWTIHNFTSNAFTVQSNLCQHTNITKPKILPNGWACPVEHSPTGGVHALNDKVVQHHLLLGTFHDVLFDTGLGDQAVDADLATDNPISYQQQWPVVQDPCSFFARERAIKIDLT